MQRTLPIGSPCQYVHHRHIHIENVPADLQLVERAFTGQHPEPLHGGVSSGLASAQAAATCSAENSRTPSGVRRSGDPGRPPLAYVANPVPDAEQGRRNFGQLAEVLAQLVTRTNQDPAAVAVEAGRSWGLSRTGTSEAANGAAAIAELTATLDELGFAPKVCVDDDDGHPIILQRHCPFLEVAQTHQDVVCSVHLGLIRGTLDRLDVPVTVERLIPFANTAGCEAHLTAGGATPATV